MVDNLFNLIYSEQGLKKHSTNTTEKGGNYMTNTTELNRIITESGLKKKFLAESCGISFQTFLNKTNNRSFFTAKEIKILCEKLGIEGETKEQIFFAE